MNQIAETTRCEHALIDETGRCVTCGASPEEVRQAIRKRCGPRASSPTA